MSKIEWTNKTWNPITGCSTISEGCKNCYAEKMSKRLAGRFGYNNEEPFKVTIHRDKFELPYLWKKPQMIFVCSMSDIFHQDVTFEIIKQIFDIMTFSQKHTYQILTKRPVRMYEFFRNYDMLNDFSYNRFKNIWFGVTAENQHQWNKRLPWLLKLPVKIKFVSCEPLLTNIDMDIETVKKLDLIITGGETGHNARPIHPVWVKNIKDKCTEADKHFFFKGWGAWEPIVYKNKDKKFKDKRYVKLTPDKNEIILQKTYFPLINMIKTKGKNRKFDGIEYNELPTIKPY
jgi:protein gp37